MVKKGVKLIDWEERKLNCTHNTLIRIVKGTIKGKKTYTDVWYCTFCLREFNIVEKVKGVKFE